MVSETAQAVDSKNEPSDTIVLDYVNRNSGALKLSEAVKELGMSREQIEESLKRLMEQNLLKANEKSMEGTNDVSQDLHKDETVPMLPQTLDPRTINTMRIYGCDNCGSPIHTFPPDDVHKIADVRTSWLVDVVEIKYTCSKCREVKHVYWRRPLTENLPITLLFRFKKGVLVPTWSFLSLGLKRLRALLRR